jgi:TolA-binding protein
MDSDKFDRIVLDLLYGELDELTTAAAKRHMDQSARARDIYAHFRATRQLGVLPAHTPPSDFEAALLQREARILAELPVRHRLGRLVSMLAGYAMRPQLIMGALLLLMIGSSLMFVRARPGLHSAVQVTERGAPEGDVDVVLPLAPPRTSESSAPASSPLPPPTPVGAPPLALEAPEPAAAPSVALSNAGSTKTASVELAPSSVDTGNDGLDAFDQALEIYRARGYIEAQRLFERLSKSGSPRAAEAALYSALALRNIRGCAVAVAPFERVGLRFPGSAAAHDASWRAAKCQEQLGDLEAARRGYESLLRVATHARRAQQALAALGGGEPTPAQ